VFRAQRQDPADHPRRHDAIASRIESALVNGREASAVTAERLDVVPWSHGTTDAVVEFTTNELTATCPITGQPDFYELKLNYRPKGWLIESKALKLYLWGFRENRIFAEDLAATLLEPVQLAQLPEPERRLDVRHVVFETWSEHLVGPVSPCFVALHGVAA
jgi:NADPH-dependent 7-cyano-7-deazaguanine reductase QueF